MSYSRVPGLPEDATDSLMASGVSAPAEALGIPRAEVIELGNVQQAIHVQVLAESVDSVQSVDDSIYGSDEKRSIPGTILYFLLVLLFFCHGLYTAEDPLEQLQLSGFVQPPESQRFLFMSAYSKYPECEDLRPELYRLITGMLVHGGIIHFAMNMICLAVFGPIYERETSAVKLWVVILTGVVFGNIAAFYASPFTSIVGASGGMYAIIGAIMSLLFIDPDALPLYRRPLISFFVFQLVFDIAIALLFPEMLSWTCHAGGLVSGVLVNTLWLDLDNTDSEDAGRDAGRDAMKMLRVCAYTTARMILRALALAIFASVFILYVTVDDPIVHYKGGKFATAIACCSNEFDQDSSCYF